LKICCGTALLVEELVVRKATAVDTARLLAPTEVCRVANSKAREAKFFISYNLPSLLYITLFKKLTVVDEMSRFPTA